MRSVITQDMSSVNKNIDKKTNIKNYITILRKACMGEIGMGAFEILSNALRALDWVNCAFPFLKPIV